LLKGSLQNSKLNRLNHVKCIESINFSALAVKPDRRMHGDLMYLNVKTLEQPNVEIGITCSVNGFFRNDSSINQFSGAPSARYPPCFSYTLAGCLN
jgi:hypothetical protein